MLRWRGTDSIGGIFAENEAPKNSNDATNRLRSGQNLKNPVFKPKNAIFELKDFLIFQPKRAQSSSLRASFSI